MNEGTKAHLEKQNINLVSNLCKTGSDNTGLNSMRALEGT